MNVPPYARNEIDFMTRLCNPGAVTLMIAVFKFFKHETYSCEFKLLPTRKVFLLSSVVQRASFLVGDRAWPYLLKIEEPM